MRKYWANLSGREKGLVSIAAAILLVLMLGQFIIKPLVKFGPQQQKLYQKAQANLEIMRSGQAVLSGTPVASKSNLQAARLMVEVTKTAAQNGLEISRRQPNGDTGISLWFEKAQSPKFYQWLDELTTQHNVTLLRANINRNNDGTIQVQVTLKLGA